MKNTKITKTVNIKTATKTTTATVAALVREMLTQTGYKTAGLELHHQKNVVVIRNSRKRVAVLTNVGNGDRFGSYLTVNPKELGLATKDWKKISETWFKFVGDVKTVGKLFKTGFQNFSKAAA